MLILTIRTDKPEAEIGLYQDEQELVYVTWPAHRQLAETLHTKIDEILRGQTKTLKDVEAITCFQGPGSFTGLRIGLAVANALATSLAIPIIGAMSDNWRQEGIGAVLSGGNDGQILPHYGAEVHITVPKH